MSGILGLKQAKLIFRATSIPDGPAVVQCSTLLQYFMENHGIYPNSNLMADYYPELQG